ncbi:MAG: glycosyltransferase family 4 protein [Actinobacteria bacterium]|nr:glycosyltransferase family 4 protein [Actinomycetota bacterium]
MTDRRRRVAIAYDCLFPFTVGGGERQYRAFAESLARSGYDVDYLTADQGAGAPLTAPDFDVVTVSPALRLYDENGVRRTGTAVVFALRLGWALLRRRRRYGTVVVSGLPALNVLTARAALLGSGTTLVVDYLEVWGRRQWAEYAGRAVGALAWAAQRLAVALTPVATCHSALTAGRLRAEGFRGTLLRSPGLIDDDAAPEPRAGAAAEPSYVVYVGRHIPDKQVESIPAAVAVARRTIPGLRLVILGSGPSTSDVRAAVGAADAAAWTELPGFVSEDDLRRIVGGAAAVVNPSRREGYGLVVVEAARHGVPVVLVEDPDNAATELVEPGTNGAVAASPAPGPLGDAIAEVVLAGPALRDRTREWYDRARRERTIDATIRQLLEVVDPGRSAVQQQPQEVPGGDPRD